MEAWGARLDKVSIHVRSVVTRKHGFVEGIVIDVDHILWLAEAELPVEDSHNHPHTDEYKNALLILGYSLRAMLPLYKLQF